MNIKNFFQNNSIIGSTFLPRVFSRISSNILSLFSIFIITNFLKIEQLVIFFVMQSFIPFSRYISNGLNGVSFFINISNKKNITPIILNHLFLLFIISFSLIFLIATIIFSSSFFNNAIHNSSVISKEIMSYFFIWIFFTVNSNAFHSIFQIRNQNLLSGLFTGFMQRSILMVLIGYFFFFSSISLNTIIFSFALSCFLNYLIGLFFIFYNQDIKSNIKLNLSISNFYSNIDPKQFINGILNSFIYPSLIWVATVYDNIEVVVVLGLFKNFINIFNNPINALNNSARTNIKKSLDQSNNRLLNTIINFLSKFLSIYFLGLSIASGIFLLLNNYFALYNAVSFSKYSEMIIALNLFFAHSTSNAILSYIFNYYKPVLMMLKRFEYLILNNIVSLSLFIIISNMIYFFKLENITFMVLMIILVNFMNFFLLRLSFNRINN